MPAPSAHASRRARFKAALLLGAPLLGTALAASACRPPVAPATPSGPDAPLPAPSDTTRMCTMEYRSYAVRVQTAAGQPVTDARLAIRRADGTDLVCAAGEERGCVTPRGSAPGGALSSYVVMTDGVPIGRAGENITVTATSGGQSVVGVFRFQHDGCHVAKVSGPDVLRMGGVKE